jgi:hypothetical protein
MNTLKYMALIVLISCGQSIWAMEEEPTKPNYCHDAIEKIKKTTMYDPISLLNLLGIQNNDDDIFDNRWRVLYIAQKIEASKDVDTNKKVAVIWFKNEINQRANAYGVAMRLVFNGQDLTKEYHIKKFQNAMLEIIADYVYRNRLPLQASPERAITAKAACIQKLRAASRCELATSKYDFLTKFLDIPTRQRQQEDINEEVYRKQRDIHAILDEVRINPFSQN